MTNRICVGLVALSFLQMPLAWAESSLEDCKKDGKVPDTMVDLVLPVGNSSSASNAARIVFETFKVENPKFGMSFTLLNKPGASGSLGISYAQNQKPTKKKITLLVAQAPDLTITPEVLPPGSPEIKPKEFKPIAKLGTMPYILICHKKNLGNARTLPDLMKVVKERSLKFGHGGPSNTTNIAMLKLSHAAGVPYEKLDPVPYKDTTVPMNELLGGQSIDCMFQSYSAASGILTSPDLVVFGTTGEKGIESASKDTPACKVSPAPNHCQTIPPIADSFEKFGELQNWVGVFGPKDLDPKLSSCFNAIVEWGRSNPKVQKLLAEQKFETSPDDTSIEKFAASYTAFAKQMAGVVPAIKAVTDGKSPGQELETAFIAK